MICRALANVHCPTVAAAVGEKAGSPVLSHQKVAMAEPLALDVAVAHTSQMGILFSCLHPASSWLYQALCLLLLVFLGTRQWTKAVIQLSGGHGENTEIDYFPSPNTNTNFFKKLIFTGVCVFTQSCPTLCDPLDYSPPGYPFHGIFSGKNSGVSCYFLLQGIFLTQGLNLCLISFVSCIAGGFFTRWAIRIDLKYCVSFCSTAKWIGYA